MRGTGTNGVPQHGRCWDASVAAGAPTAAEKERGSDGGAALPTQVRPTASSAVPAGSGTGDAVIEVAAEALDQPSITCAAGVGDRPGGPSSSQDIPGAAAVAAAAAIHDNSAHADADPYPCSQVALPAAGPSSGVAHEAGAHAPEQASVLGLPGTSAQPAGPAQAAAAAVVLVLVGVQGSGKSTFCQRLSKASGRQWVRVNQDTINNGKRGSKEMCLTAARQALTAGRSVVVDRTNIDVGQRAPFLQLAQQCGAEAHCLVLRLPVKTCMSRAAGREKHEGGLQGKGAYAAVNIMHSAYMRVGPPTEAEGFGSIVLCESDADVDAALHAWATFGVDHTDPLGTWKRLAPPRKEPLPQGTGPASKKAAGVKPGGKGSIESFFQKRGQGSGGGGGAGSRPELSVEAPNGPSQDGKAASGRNKGASKVQGNTGSTGQAQQQKQRQPPGQKQSNDGQQQEAQQQQLAPLPEEPQVTHQQGTEDTKQVMEPTQTSAHPKQQNALALLMSARQPKSPAVRPGSSSAGAAGAPASQEQRGSRHHFPTNLPALRALMEVAARPERSASDPAFYTNDTVVRITDKFPKARHHALVIARDPRLQGPLDLTSADTALVEHMMVVGREWAEQQEPKDGPQHGFFFGFHSAPSLRQLHLHVISKDLDSPFMKTKKHFLSFASPFFLHASAVLAQLQRSDKLDYSEQEKTKLLNGPLRRHLTQQGSPVPPGIYNPSPSPERQGGDESPPLASPSPSPSPDRQGGDESPLPSPSPSDSPSPSPAPGPTCSGVAYDGYLSNCGLQFDATVVDGLVKAITVVSGQFDTNMTASQLGAGYLTPAPSSTPLTAVPDGQSIPYCYDMVTRLPELLPLATTPPTDCSKPVVVDIASTVLQYGIKNNVAGAGGRFNEDAFKTALNISSAIDIGHYDALAAAQSSDAATRSQGVEVLKTLSNLRILAQLFAQASVRDRAALAQMAKQVFVSLAQYIADGGAGQPETRRLLTAGTPLDLTSAQEVQAAMSTLQASIQQAVANGDLDATQVEQIVDPAIQQAISRAIATINSIAMSATSLEDIQRAIQVAVTTLSSNIQQLIATGDLTTFNAQTSAASLQQAVNQATLAGGSVAPAGHDDSGSSSKGKLIGGLVGGLVGGFLVISAIVGFIVYRRRRRAAGAAPAAQ
ncbi:hypothetical protein N2152v2_003009 [Parachlorella kessleri]